MSTKRIHELEVCRKLFLPKYLLQLEFSPNLIVKFCHTVLFRICHNLSL